MRLKPSSLEKSTNIYFSLLMLTQDRVYVPRLSSQPVSGTASLWLKIALKQNGLHMTPARVVVLILLEVQKSEKISVSDFYV